jgi:hypothetical protein
MVTSIGFPLLAAVLVALLLAAGRRVLPLATFVRFMMAVGLWLFLVGELSVSGVLGDFELRPPPFAVLFLACMAVAAALAFSRVGTALSGLPSWWLVGFQAFRLPLEWLMHEAFRAGLMPEQMSWSGQNLDVLTGATAPVVAALLAKGVGGPRLALVWNLLGSALLANIVVVAVASTPMLHAFGTAPERLNTFVAAWPYVTLPTVMVVLALAGHLVLFRRLRRELAGAEATSS